MYIRVCEERKTKLGLNKPAFVMFIPPHLATNPDLDDLHPNAWQGFGVPAGGDESHRMRFLGEGVVVLPF